MDNKNVLSNLEQKKGWFGCSRVELRKEMWLTFKVMSHKSAEK